MAEDDKLYVLEGYDPECSKDIAVFEDKELAQKALDMHRPNGRWFNYRVKEKKALFTSNYSLEIKYDLDFNFIFCLFFKYDPNSDNLKLDREFSWFKTYNDDEYYEDYPNHKPLVMVYDDYSLGYVTIHSESKKSFLHAYDKARDVINGVIELGDDFEAIKERYNHKE